jgi:hypothetical protein
MATRKLPAYFREYLDERFMHVIGKIGDVEEEVIFVKNELKRMNASVSKVKNGLNKVRVKSNHLSSKYIPDYKKTKKMADRNRKIILLGGFALVLVLALTVKESGGEIIKAIWSALAGLL